MKRVLAIVLAAVMVLGLMGCGEAKVLDGKVGDTINTEFFEFTLTDVKATTDDLDGHPVEEGYQFVTANVSVTSTADDTINVGNYDFTISWEGDEEAKEEDHYAYGVFMDGMYTDGSDIKKGESESGLLVFAIPADVKTCQIAYETIYDTEETGDTHTVECTL